MIERRSVAKDNVVEAAELAYHRYHAKGTRAMLLAWFRAEVAELPVRDQAVYADYTDEAFEGETRRFEDRSRRMRAARIKMATQEVVAQLA